MVIQHNIPALNAHRNMGINNTAISGNLEKLSSGYRINRAADDAAGLAISEKMRGQIRGLAMAEQNTSHGINLIQTAEGGLSETQDILQRMRELAVQSSNGTYQDDDRAQLALEYNALKSEIDRIAESTHYNGIKLLNGNLVDGTYTQRVKDTDDILLNAAFGTNTKAGDEFLVSLVSGAVSTQEVYESKTVDKAPTTSSFSYDLSGMFTANSASAISDLQNKGQIEFNFDTTEATNVAKSVVINAVNIQAYYDRNDIEDAMPTTNEELKEVIAAMLSESLSDAGTGYGFDIDVSWDGDVLVFTAAEEGASRLDVIFLDEIDTSNTTGGTDPLTTATVATFNAAVTAATSAHDVKINVVEGEDFGWAKTQVAWNIGGLTFHEAGGILEQGTKASERGDYLAFEFGGEEIRIEIPVGFFDSTGGGTVNLNDFKDQVTSLLVEYFESEQGTAVLDKLGLELGTVVNPLDPDSTAATGTGSITFVAKEYGYNDALSNLQLGNFSVRDSEDKVYEGFGAAATIRDGIDGQTTTQQVLVGKQQVLDVSAISINGESKNVKSAVIDEKTNMITITDTDDNVFTIDSARVAKSKVDDDGNALAYEVTVRAAEGDNLVFQIGANGGSDQRVYLAVDKMDSFNLGLYEGDLKSNGIAAAADEEAMLSSSNITTVEDANKAIDIITAATNQVSSQRAELGALQNRLESTLNSLGVSKENLTAAESTIRDVDMAAEMMEFTKNSILVQAAQAMLAQANQLPQGVLQLLR